MATITQDLGKVAYLSKGAYSSSTQYEKNDVVTYQGSSYVSLQATKGNAPTNTTYWQLIAEKGGTGPSNELTIGVVEKGINASATITGTSPNQVLNLVLPKGDKGEQGLPGQPSGSPLVASSISGMTDTTKVYVNTSDGNWYYYNGSTWVSGGVYTSVTGYDEALNDSTIIPEMYKFTKRNLRDNLTINSGKNLPSTAWNNSTTIENFNSKLANSSVGNISNPFRIKYDNGTPIITTWNFILSASASSQTAFFIHYFDVNGAYLSGQQFYTYNGAIPNNAYYGCIVYYNNIVFTDHKFDYKTVEWLNNNQNIYYIGNNNDDDYSGILECFQDLANNQDEKTIYIRPGTYDIFQEMGGSAFGLSITSEQTWGDVSVFVLDNTHIIGLGEVVLNLLPESNQISDAGSFYLSILNVKGNCEIENLTLNAKNVRYCIHDEVGTDIAYYYKIHKYKNIRCNYISKAVNGIGGQAYASGFVNGNIYEFNNCSFITNVGKPGLSFHNGAGGTGNITFNNCIFKSYNNNYDSVAFDNTSTSQYIINVNISNCYVGSKGLKLGKNYASSSLINNFKLCANNCNNFNISVEDGLTNNLTPSIYNSISN